MRVVADTNILISGLLWHGAPRRFIDAAQADVIELVTSQVLLDELARVAKRGKLRLGMTRISDLVWKNGCPGRPGVPVATTRR